MFTSALLFTNGSLPEKRGSIAATSKTELLGLATAVSGLGNLRFKSQV